MFWRRTVSARPRLVPVPFEDGVLDLTAAPGTPADPAEARRLAFVREAWVTLAAAAFEGWRRYGVGTLVVEPAALDRGAFGPAVAPHLLYATGDAPWAFLSRRTPAGAWADDACQTYDPRTTALLVFTADGEAPRFYRVSGTPGPRAAFERVRALRN